MKIAIIVTSLGLGGAERSAAIQSEIFTQNGHQVHVIIMSSIVVYPYKGTLLDLGALKQKYHKKWANVQRLKILRKYLLEQKIALIVDNRMRTNGFLPEVLLSKYAYRAIKTIYVMHSASYIQEFKAAPWQKKWLFKDAFAMVGVSKGLTDFIKQTHGNIPAVTIYNSFSKQHIQDALLAQNSSIFPFEYLVYVGRLEQKCKNISSLLQAYHSAKIHHNNIHLVFIGEGEDLPMYQNMVTALDLDDFVHFMGFKTNPYIYIKQALALVLSSVYEGFPMVLIEALACKTPVVATNCVTGPSEVIQTGYNGILVPVKQVEALAKALEKITTDSVFRAHCQKNALASITAFTPEQIAQHWECLIQAHPNGVS